MASARLGIPARRELPVFKKQPEAQHVAKINPRTLRQKLAELGAAMELDLTQVAKTESDASGSDYSETEREVRRRKGAGSGDEDSDGGDDEEDGAKTATPTPHGGKRKGGDGESSQNSDSGNEYKAKDPEANFSLGKSKGKEVAGNGKSERRREAEKKKKGKSRNESKEKEKTEMKEETSGGRPSAEQLESVKELREAIDERIGEISAEFESSTELVLRQLGLGVWKEVRKMSLWNMFSQIKSLEGEHDDVQGCE